MNDVVIKKWDSFEPVSVIRPVLEEYFGAAHVANYIIDKLTSSPFGVTAAVAWDGPNPVAISLADLRPMTFDDGCCRLVAFSIGNFVTTEYRGRGLFIDVLVALDDYVTEQGAEIVFTYPSNKSGPGFRKAGYVFAAESVQDVSASVRLPLSLVGSLGSSLGSFRPIGTRTPRLDEIEDFADRCVAGPGTTSLLSAEFLQYRLAGFRKQHYEIDFFAGVGVISMHGHRGKLRETRILATSSRVPDQWEDRRIYRALRSRYSSDLVSRRRTDLAPPRFDLNRSYGSIIGRPSLYCKSVGEWAKSNWDGKVFLSGIDTHTW